MPTSDLRPEPRAAPLRGIRVVALEQAVAGPLCTRHLVDLGADVIKIERPGGGDFSRSYDSVVHGESAYFVWLNRGKRSVVLDLKSANDRVVVDSLLESADVLVSNLGPGALERLGLGWDAVHAQWPQLISCTITGYGTEGPLRNRKAFDLLVQGEAALFAITGAPEQPAKVGLPIADISGGMYALSGVLAALFQRESTGLGTRIDIAMLDCIAEWMTPILYHREYTGKEPERSGVMHATICPYGPYRVGGGQATVNIAVQNQRQWRAFCTFVLERPDLVDDDRFRSNEARVRHRDELEILIDEFLAAVPLTAVLASLDRADIPWAEVNDVGALLDHPQLRARARWTQVDTPSGLASALRSPLDARDSNVSTLAVPALGEHTSEVLEQYAQASGTLDSRPVRRATK
ncbi:MAG TPA: CaiB/BaiF CoA-transferase family protein [Gemmatimonadaceae bacterium]